MTACAIIAQDQILETLGLSPAPCPWDGEEALFIHQFLRCIGMMISAGCYSVCDYALPLGWLSTLYEYGFPKCQGRRACHFQFPGYLFLITALCLRSLSTRGARSSCRNSYGAKVHWLEVVRELLDEAIVLEHQLTDKRSDPVYVWLIVRQLGTIARMIGGSFTVNQ